MKDNKKVILSMPEPKEWTFMSVRGTRGQSVAEFWDAPTSFEAEISFSTMIGQCRRIENYLDWPAFRHRMKGEAGKLGIMELEFKADNKAYRVLCKRNGTKCIVLLCICYHKGSNWTPSNAIKLAMDRAKALEDGRAEANVIEKRDDI